MRVLEGNEILLTFSTGDYSLVNSKFISMEIYKKGQSLTIDVRIDLLYSKYEQQMDLRFIDVSSYFLDGPDLSGHLSIEQYKFFRNHDGFYMGFNPYESFSGVSDEYYIKSKNVRATLMK